MLFAQYSCFSFDLYSVICAYLLHPPLPDTGCLLPERENKRPGVSLSRPPSLRKYFTQNLGAEGSFNDMKAQYHGSCTTRL